MLGIKNLSIAGRGGSSAWWDKMWSSYTQLNPGVYSDAIATEFKRRMKPDYVENLVPNGGGLNATDWIDTNADGLADRFTSYGGTTSIVTGNGFLGRAQRILSTGTNALVYSEFSFPTGIVYNITFTHRSNNGIALNLVGSNVVLPVLPANTGAAKQETIISTNPATTALLVFYCRGVAAAQVGDWFEIGNITVTTKVSQNYFSTFGPSGLNKTTADWIYLLTTSGNITSRAITKSGNTLKWNLDGTIVTQNPLPNYTKGTNAGIITFTSTDGFGGVTSVDLLTNSFNGVCPTFVFANITRLSISNIANFTGVLPTFNCPKLADFFAQDSKFSSVASIDGFATNKISQFHLSNNTFNTSNVNYVLSYFNSMFAVTPPIKNLTLNLSGATMGIPTGAGSNTDLLGILAKFTAAGFTATIIVRTS